MTNKRYNSLGCTFFVFADKKSGKIFYSKAEFNVRNKIYQSVKPDFNPDVEYMKDLLSRDVPPVDNSLRKLILEIALFSTSNVKKKNLITQQCVSRLLI